MLIIENGLVYQIDGEIAAKLMQHDSLFDARYAVTQRTQAIVSDMMDGDKEYLNNQHLNLALRMEKMRDPKFLEVNTRLYRGMFDLFKERVLRSGDTMTSYIKPDVTIDQVPHIIHNENGLAFDFDRGIHIDCADCNEKINVMLDFMDSVVAVQIKSNEGTITEEDITALVDKMPDVADGYPPVIIPIHTKDGTIVVGPKDTTPEFDEDLPMPTHVVKSTLN